MKNKASKQQDSWESLKSRYLNWREALRDASKEVQDIGTGIKLGIVLGIITFLVGLVYDLPQLSGVVRLVIIPAVLLTLLGFYLVVVASWTIGLVRLRWLKSEWERTKEEAACLSEISDIREKPFNYVLEKIDMLLQSTKGNHKNSSSKIIFLSPLDENTLKEIESITKLASTHNIKFEWNITEKTVAAQRTPLSNDLRKFILSSGNAYLTGELPVFDKLLVIPGLIIIAFIKDFWFSWNLDGRALAIDEIKEKIVLTPFSAKISQFFGRARVHSAISCYLSEVVNMEGFVIGAEHPYLWIEEPKKLFEEFTKYQEVVNERFEVVSDELRSLSVYITSNLPLLDNYRAIISDTKIQEWLTELKNEANQRQTLAKVNDLVIPALIVDRYIYVVGHIRNDRWEIEASYLNEVCSFLRRDFFSSLPYNYRIWIVLGDEDKLKGMYNGYTAGVTELPFEEIVSNWIWFKCKDKFHVLQYEKGLKVEDRVAEALAPVLRKDKSELSKISVFMFADAVDPDSQQVMKKYQSHKEFLKSCRDTYLAIPLQNFLTNYCSSPKT